MTALPPLLSANTVHARRQLPIWIALTFSAGAVNAVALAACQRFVTHVTGTATLVGTDHQEPWLVVQYACVLVCFILGAMTSVVLLDGRRLRHRAPMPLVPLTIVVAVLATTAGLGIAGVFGPFGSTVETPGDFVLLSLLAFAMGLQNASVATTTGMIVRTTHMTGPVTDFAVAIATALMVREGVVAEAARRSAWIRGWKIAAFIGGALAGALVAMRAEYAAFLLPAGTTLGATLLLWRSLEESQRPAELLRPATREQPIARPDARLEPADASAE